MANNSSQNILVSNHGTKSQWK